MFALCYSVAHYQFKYFIPVTVFIFKAGYALTLLLSIRLYYLLRVEGHEINWQGLKEDFASLMNVTALAFEL